MFLFFVVVGVTVFLFVEHRKEKREKYAVMLNLDISRKFEELMNDPFMNASKWRDWLPVFEYADEVIGKNSRTYIPSRAEYIRTQILGESVADS